MSVAVAEQPTTIEGYVQAGAELLDTKVPGWADRINVESFDIRDGCRCILGQLYGLYSWGWLEIGDTENRQPYTSDQAVHLGFYVPHNGDPAEDFNERVYETGQAWVDEIEHRRNG